MARIITRELVQEEAEALVAKNKAPAAPVPAIAPPVTEPPKALPATPQPGLAQPVASGPGGDTRDSGQPSVHETLTSVAKTMKGQE